MVDTIFCVHCGAAAKHPVTKTTNGITLNFCCGGCLQVYELLHEGELPAVQSGQEMDPGSHRGEVIPAGPLVEGADPYQTVEFLVKGMSCSNCVSTVERHLRSINGVMDVQVVLETERAAVRVIPGGVTMADLKSAVEKAGYKVSSSGTP